jgi:Dolichyl-phosphate-mannose-protein mannosyltransferase
MKAEPREHLKDSWLSQHPFVVLGIVLIGCLGPFVNKAIQGDDALFVWTGQWIQGHPMDFFGGKTNWWFSTMPMWMANWNPPLMSYFLAAVASIFGWSEIPMHVACIGVAFAAAAGIHSLAKMWCQRPLLATVIAIFTPAFLVSATTLMCDVLMLAFWVWSLAVFVRALETETRWQFALAGVLAGLAILTKYSALMLLPLMAAMGILRKKKTGWWLLALVMPMIIAAIYEFLTAKLYGHGLISVARLDAQIFRFGFPGGATARAIIALTFAGGLVAAGFLPGPMAVALADVGDWWNRDFGGLNRSLCAMQSRIDSAVGRPGAWDYWGSSLKSRS